MGGEGSVELLDSLIEVLHAVLVIWVGAEEFRGLASAGCLAEDFEDLFDAGWVVASLDHDVHALIVRFGLMLSAKWQFEKDIIRNGGEASNVVVGFGENQEQVETEGPLLGVSISVSPVLSSDVGQLVGEDAGELIFS